MFDFSFTKIKKIWESNGFEICVCVSLIIILILSLFNRGKKGTWSKVRGFALPKGKKYPDVSQSELSNKRGPSESKGEIECRRVLENKYGKPFVKVRPDILSNPITGGVNLEIDCYNDDLKIGVEYNGVQHYKYTPYFHKNKEAFQNQQYRDYMKKDMCQKNGILLIDVPYTVKIQDIESYLLQRLP
jgi:hypothetical protein